MTRQLLWHGRRHPRRAPHTRESGVSQHGESRSRLSNRYVPTGRPNDGGCRNRFILKPRGATTLDASVRFNPEPKSKKGNHYACANECISLLLKVKVLIAHRLPGQRQCFGEQLRLDGGEIHRFFRTSKSVNWPARGAKDIESPEFLGSSSCPLKR